MRRYLSAAVVAALLVSVAACGGDDDDSAEPAETTAAEAAPETTEAEETPATTAAEESPATTEAEESPTTTAAEESPTTTAAVELDLPDEIVIGAPLDMSGSAGVAAVGVSELDGINLAAKEINESGFLGDSQIVIESIDTLGDTQEAVRATLELISSEVDAVVGFTITPSWLAAAPQLQDAGIPAMAVELSASGVTEVGDLMFRLYPDMGKLIPVADVEFAEHFGGTTAAYLYQGDAGSTAEIQPQRKAALEAAGVETVEEQTISATDTDVRAQLTAIAESDPDFVVVTVLPGLMSTVFLQMQEIGLDAQILGQVPNPELIEQAGDALQCFVYIAPWASFFTEGNNEHFLEYNEEFGPDRPVDLFIAAGYSAMWAMAHGIREANSVEGADIAAALSTMDPVDTAYGTVDFKTNRSANVPGQKAIVIDSEIVPWTEDTVCEK